MKTAAIKIIVWLGLPLCAWRVFYPMTDWAALCFVPLAWALFLGTYHPAISAHRAKMEMAIIPGTALSRLFSGAAVTIVFSAAFTIVAITVLAWQALTVSAAETAALLALCFLAGGLSLWTQARLKKCLRPPFARAIGMGFGYAAVGLAFVFILAWINWQFVSHPGYIRSSGLAEAVLTAINELPDRGGVITATLSVFYALDTFKIWFAARIGNSFWIMILYCLDAALVAFIAAKSSVAVADFRGIIPGKQQ